MENDMTILVQKALHLLRRIGLKEGTLKSYDNRAFRPIINYHETLNTYEFQEPLMNKLEIIYRSQFENESISKNTLNWRIRGIKIISEIYATGSYEWKVYSNKKTIPLPDSFECMVNDFVSRLDLSEKREHNIESIIRRFVKFIIAQDVSGTFTVTPVMVQEFMLHISFDRPKSMDDVVDALKKFFRYLNEQISLDSHLWMLLAAPRGRDRKVKPCMKTNEVYQMLGKINRSSPRGKRDFAILTLVATTGLRAGDIANLKLTDIIWKQNELHFIQGKTQKLLVLPLQKNIMNALANYILYGRPNSDSSHIFLRSYAPYTSLFDGSSVSCIFRKYLSKAEINHLINDGKTLHGMRRMIGTQMLISGTPIATVAQVLGHTNLKTIKQYISLDLEGLRNCSFPMTSLGGEDR
ncbi:MAG: tyrosine-type recombinase/integrase [Candidatus Theseobacter exili]|nr:tyrosine-type recombinase/integrase [Candidatus Theseobacter exili]